MGALDYLSNFCTVISTKSKPKPMQVTVIPSISQRKPTAKVAAVPDFRKKEKLMELLLTLSTTFSP